MSRDCLAYLRMYFGIATIQVRTVKASHLDAEHAAMIALAAAAQLPHGDERTLAMRKAGQLQLIADAKKHRLQKPEV